MTKENEEMEEREWQEFDAEMTRLRKLLLTKAVKCSECKHIVRAIDAWKSGNKILCNSCLIKLNPEQAKTFGWDYRVALERKYPLAMKRAWHK